MSYGCIYIYIHTHIFMVCGCIWSALFLEMFTFRALFSVIQWATVVPRKALEISLFLFWIKMVQWQTKSTGWMWPIAPWLCGWCGNCGLSFYIYINTCIYTYCLLLVQCVFPLPILLCLGGSVCLNILYQATLVWGSTAEPPYDTKIYTQDMRLFENIASLFLF